jgi:hypothetical protein
VVTRQERREIIAEEVLVALATMLGIVEAETSVQGERQ